MRIALAAKRELSGPCADRADSPESKVGLSKLHDRAAFCFHLVGYEFLETAGTKAFPECRPPHFQHLHLLVIRHRIDLALHNFEPLAESAVDDWFFFFRWFQRQTPPSQAPKGESSTIGCFTVRNYQPERFEINLFTYHDARLAPAVTLDRSAVNAELACRGGDRHRRHRVYNA
jgi:hypothetical protein